MLPNTFKDGDSQKLTLMAAHTYVARVWGYIPRVPVPSSPFKFLMMNPLFSAFSIPPLSTENNCDMAR